MKGEAWMLVTVVAAVVVVVVLLGKSGCCRQV